jgi:hypothetical protein
MKKIFTLVLPVLLISFLFTSCVKQAPFDDSYWLSKERGEVIYSSPTCAYYVVETYNGYSVIRAVDSRPYEGDIVYGDFSQYGIVDVYNRSRGILMTADVRDYWLTYYGAQDAIDYYCY